MNQEQFRHPPAYYREVPFWSWNDKLDPRELTRQIALIAEGGWGGFFMHARVGLQNPYLGETWLEGVRTCIEAARKHDLQAWLYDEEKWPSGFAGGLGVASNAAFRGRHLVCQVTDRPALIAERIATFSARDIDDEIVDIRPYTPFGGHDEDRIVQFYLRSLPLGMSWYSGTSYLDTLNPEAVRAFLGSTHEVYAEVFGDSFGSVIPGIFTDEPSLFIPLFEDHEASLNVLPWTDGFAEHFKGEKGYDLLPHLPSLFFEHADYRSVRHDYWEVMARRFLTSYTGQVSSWCASHGLELTGHLMGEDTLAHQVPWSGSVMPHYALMQRPGVDKLGRQLNAGAGTVLTLKQLDSVVAQTGKARALCENLGCTGQDFAHSGRKWLTDWASVLGMNASTPHLAAYSLRGERKRDYPPTLFVQQPWWPENHIIADYTARLSYALSQGDRVVDILVIHPLASAWSIYSPASRRAVEALDRMLDALLQGLMCAQRDFHLGDETLMAEGQTAAHMTVEGGQARLVVGEMTYQLVIVPPGVTLAAATVRLLRDFAARGGPVLALAPLPDRIAGRQTSHHVLPPTTLITTLPELSGHLDTLLPFDVCVPQQPSIWVHHRRVGGRDLYFVVNTELTDLGKVVVQVRGTGQIERWEAATGEVEPFGSRQRGDVTEVTLAFPPAGSHLLMLDRSKPPESVVFNEYRRLRRIRLDDPWILEPGGPNALLLDRPELRLGDNEWEGPINIRKVQERVARAGRGTSIALRFVFDADHKPSGPLALVMEMPESFSVEVNGWPISGTSGWWLDPAFCTLALDNVIEAGRNEIILRGVSTRRTELEAIYLTGTFGISGQRLARESVLNGQVFDRYASNFRLVAPPERLVRSEGPGLCFDLTNRGYPFFAGRVRLRQEIVVSEVPGEAILKLANLRAAVTHVRVNGQVAGTLAWEPHATEVGQLLQRGMNVIELELVGTLRNLLGPHHLKGGDGAWTGPSEFRASARWTDDVVLTPFGFDEAMLTL